MSTKRPITLARNARRWNSASWAVMKWSLILFTSGGFLASFAAMQGTGGITINGEIIEGWPGIWLVTGLCAVAGLLFAGVWMIIFKALAEASKG